MVKILAETNVYSLGVAPEKVCRKLALKDNECTHFYV